MIDWKAPLRNLLARMGWEIRRSPDTFFIKLHEVDLVLDVGANKGQYGQSLRQRGYRGEIRSFEPSSEDFRILSAKAAGDPLWKVTQTAVGSMPGEAELNISGFTGFNSFKPLSEFGEAVHHQVGVVRTERVPIARLEDLVPDYAGRKLFLKADVQGFEREVLEGAGEVLKNAEGVMLELPLAHLYKGVWSFIDALQYMESKGFVPAQFRYVGPIPKDQSSAIEIDCVFRRSEM